MNFSGSHSCKCFWGSRHHEVSKEHNEFHELWIINVVEHLEKSSIFSVHRCHFGFVHWVLLGKCNLEWKSSWLSLVDESFFHQGIIVAVCDTSEANFFSSLDFPGCNHLKTVLCSVKLGGGASVVVVVEVVQDWYHSVSYMFSDLDCLEMCICVGPCLFVLIKGEFSSRFSWDFLLYKIVIVFNLFLKLVNMWS